MELNDLTTIRSAHVNVRNYLAKIPARNISLFTPFFIDQFELILF
jgi:hypothetical protein